MNAIDGLSVRRWVARIVADGLGPVHVHHAYRLLVEVFRSANQCGVTPRNPCAGVKLPRRPPHEAVVLEPTQIASLCHAIGSRYSTLINLLAYAALRFGEAAALRRERVHADEGRLLVSEAASKVRGHLVFGPTKTYGVRMVAVPPFLAAEMRRYLRDHVASSPRSLVFTSPRGDPLRIANFATREFRPAVTRAGLPTQLRLHDLRHTAATLLIAQGAHPKAVQQHLVHSNIDITMNRYRRLLPDHHDDVATRLEAAYRGGRSQAVRPRGRGVVRA